MPNWSVELATSEVSEVHGLCLSPVDGLESAGWHLLPSVIGCPLLALHLHALFLPTHVHVLTLKRLWLVVVLWIPTRNINMRVNVIVVGVVWKWGTLHLLLLCRNGSHAHVGLCALVHLLLPWTRILQILLDTCGEAAKLAGSCSQCSGSMLLVWISYTTFLFLFFICKTISQFVACLATPCVRYRWFLLAVFVIQRVRPLFRQVCDSGDLACACTRCVSCIGWLAEKFNWLLDWIRQLLFLYEWWLPLSEEVAAEAVIIHRVRLLPLIFVNVIDFPRGYYLRSFCWWFC